MAHGKPRDPRKQLQWRRWIELQQRSGLTIRDFCAQQHLSEASFYAWKRELQKRHTEANTFVPVRILDNPQPDTAIEVVLERGPTLRINAGFDPDTLRRLLAVLEENKPC